MTSSTTDGANVKRDLGLYDYLPYDYLPYDRRPKIRWPNGARVAFWLAPNIEFYELAPPRNPTRVAWSRPVPDVLGYSYRDYGNRAGFWRMLEIFDRCRVRGSVSLNVAVCQHHPEVIEECAKRGWEFYSHGTYTVSTSE
jgi:allantoinase